MARAEADTFGLGSGRDGVKTVTAAAGETINTYAQVTTALAAGGKTVTVGARVGAAATFTVGQVVMIVQSHNGFATQLVSGAGNSLDLTNTKPGHYELARIATVAGNDVTFTHGVVAAFDANDTQIVSVPEYTTLTINAGAKIIPSKWNGTTGGIVAFLATGAVTNGGTIDVASAGFRGGLFINSAAAPHACAALDGVPGAGGNGAGGGHKGEGLDGTAFSTSATFVPASPHHYARGEVGNGGGGGDCFNAGGGGGGHGGKGGKGGLTNQFQDSSRDVGGLGGVVVAYDPAKNVSLGGAGGAGEGDDNVGGDGGTGGGIVWMRADSLAGAGTITANGGGGENAQAPANPLFTDGGGGGGAGGGVFAWFKGQAVCAAITANGGGGGNASPVTPGNNYGPGGGGGGGRVQVAKSGGTCNVSVTSGAAGVTGATNGGATNGNAGTSATNAAFANTNCTTASGQCGGCIADSMCPPATPKCVLDPGATQFTCIAAPVGGKSPYGQPPAGGAQCTAGATPTQGTSTGCLNDLCDTKDNLCGYATGTACTADNQCRSNDCGNDGKCAAPTSGDGGVADGGGDGGNGDGGRTDGGTSSGGPIDNGNGDNNGVGDDDLPGTSLEGGGCSIGTASTGNMIAVCSVLGLALLGFARRRRR